ncbi:hypothetical protein BJX63DRAFT_290879 [Aspergillus granulosus]|uniref:Uncharacterized protein n=1 Tax=Aspergillus granulosus TaxID=176169 RepID=A0ABR4H6P2_9EURO
MALFLTFASLGSWIGATCGAIYPVSFFGVGTQGGNVSGKIPFLFFISHIPIYLRILFFFFWIVNHVLIDIRDGGGWPPAWPGCCSGRRRYPIIYRQKGIPVPSSLFSSSSIMCLLEIISPYIVPEACGA